MKQTTKKQPLINQKFTRKLETHPPTARRVAIVFLPHRGWQAEVGRTPAPEFSTRSARHDIARDNPPLTGYKRPRVGSRLGQAFAPLELVIDAAKQRADRRQASCRVAPKSPMNQ